jgi:hypothetical protein
MTHLRFSGYVPNKSNHETAEREAGKSAAAPLPEAAVGSLGKRQIDTAASSRQTLASTSGMTDVTGQNIREVHATGQTQVEMGPRGNNVLFSGHSGFRRMKLGTSRLAPNLHSLLALCCHQM